MCFYCWHHARGELSSAWKELHTEESVKKNPCWSSWRMLLLSEEQCATMGMMYSVTLSNLHKPHIHFNIWNMAWKFVLSFAYKLAVKYIYSTLHQAVQCVSSLQDCWILHCVKWEEWSQQLDQTQRKVASAVGSNSKKTGSSRWTRLRESCIRLYITASWEFQPDCASGNQLLIPLKCSTVTLTQLWKCLIWKIHMTLPCRTECTSIVILHRICKSVMLTFWHVFEM